MNPSVILGRANNYVVRENSRNTKTNKTSKLATVVYIVSLCKNKGFPSSVH